MKLRYGMKELPIGETYNGCKLVEDLGMRHRPNTNLNRTGRIKKIRYAKFICNCSNAFEAVFIEVRSGRIKSCGCLSKNKPRKHEDRIYRIYHGIKTRCYNPNTRAFKHYGGRGIVVCDEWLEDFNVFRSWAIENGYSDNLTIDRIDVDGNYEPINCRWVTKEVQANNQRIRSDNKTGFKGISKKSNGSWCVDHKSYYIGTYDTLEVAVQVKQALEKFSGLIEEVKDG